MFDPFDDDDGFDDEYLQIILITHNCKRAQAARPVAVAPVKPARHNLHHRKAQLLVPR